MSTRRKPTTRKTTRSANANRHPGRSIRVPDDEWGAALAVAQERGDSLSQVVRYYLARYAENPPQRLRFPKPKATPGVKA